MRGVSKETLLDLAAFMRERGLTINTIPMASVFIGKVLVTNLVSSNPSVTPEDIEIAAAHIEQPTAMKGGES